MARTYLLRSTDVDRCPKRSFSVRHYRDDGSCRCDERKAARAAVEEAERISREARRRLREARDWLEST